jgi:hypothetical protein
MESLETIIQNIQTWKNLCGSKTIEKFAQTFHGAIGIHFMIPPEMNSSIDEQKKMLPPGENDYYHAYPGITDDGELKYYMIHAIYDTEEYFERGILEYIVECKILRFGEHLVGSPISPAEADRLIGNWEKKHKEWIPKQTDSIDGMYRAIAIPEADIPDDKPLIGFFALKENLNGIEQEQDSNLIADLVFWDLKHQAFLNREIYYDLARPVPPFKKGSALAEENFYLLTCPVPNEHL